ncbi:MAG: hypothetical protein M3071_04980 [Actinomycetota bacterium]|nr:hypothetical protein [Actinomycetota bacterium]
MTRLSSRPGPASRWLASGVLVAGSVPVALGIAVLIVRFPPTLGVPLTAGAALLLAAGLVSWGVRERRLTSPPVLMGVPLLLGLAAAMAPITKLSWGWDGRSLAFAWGIALAPLIGMAIYHALARTRSEHPHAPVAAPTSPALVSCLGLLLVGCAAQLYLYAQIGGAPLLSGDPGNAKGLLGQTSGLGLVSGFPVDAAIIAAWTLARGRECLTVAQRRAFLGVVVLVPPFNALSGGRVGVVVALISMACVSGLRVQRRKLGLAACVVAIAAASTYIFISRIQHQANDPVAERILFDASGRARSLQGAISSGLLVNLGEGFRVASELQRDRVKLPPLTTSIFFLHRIFPRAQSSDLIAQRQNGFWITATYAGPLILDLGPASALGWGALLGLVFAALDRRRRRAPGWAWVYAAVAGPLTVSFYAGTLNDFSYPWVDVFVLSMVALALTKARPARAARTSRYSIARAGARG